VRLPLHSACNTGWKRQRVMRKKSDPIGQHEGLQPKRFGKRTLFSWPRLDPIQKID
jgi:hypothetical protein